MANTVIKGIPATANGDRVIAYTDYKTFRTNFSDMDQKNLYTWYKDDPDRNHLGMIELFAGISRSSIPMYLGLIRSGSIINVNGPNAAFTYDIPVYKEEKVMTVVDTSTLYSKPGIDGGLFEIVLNDTHLTAFDVITYDVQRGCDILISGEIAPKPEGENMRYWCRVIGNGKADYFPKDKLRAGIHYWKIGHALNEFSTQFSKVQGQNMGGFKTCEFRLGNHRGVESETTMYAGMKSYSGASTFTKRFIDEVEQRVTELSGDYKNNIAIIGRPAGRTSIDRSTARVVAVQELLVWMELIKLENYQLMFQQGGYVKDGNGVFYLNEGYYHQVRRGPTIQYARPGGLKRSHFLNAANYIFRERTDIKITDRKMRFKVGGMALVNVQQIFREEFYSQLEGLRQFLGTDMLIQNPISGPNDALRLSPVVIASVFLPGIGNVEVEHDPSLDNAEMVDRSQLVNGTTPLSSYSLIIENITDTNWTNAYANIPRNVTYQPGTERNNVFYVKPEGPNLFYGHKTGRWSSMGASEIASSFHEMAEQFWAHSLSAVWVRDISKFLTIELDPRTI